jgi:hypothetical protein
MVLPARNYLNDHQQITPMAANIHHHCIVINAEREVACLLPP